MTAREEILARVRRALADVPANERADDVVVPRAYHEHEAGATLARFVERVSDYGVDVTQAESQGVAAAIAGICSSAGVGRVVVPADLPAHWLPAGLEAVADVGIEVRALDAIGATITGCSLAIAETGTIVLDAGERQGRRVLTLVPDFHLCVVEEAQVVDGVPSAMRRLGDNLRGERRPVTFVSGPSATSDIELSRVEGVHGPRRLEILVVRRRMAYSGEPPPPMAA